MQFTRMRSPVSGSVGLNSIRVPKISSDGFSCPAMKHESVSSWFSKLSGTVNPIEGRGSVKNGSCGSISVAGRGSVFVINRKRSSPAKFSVMVKRGSAKISEP